MKELGLHLPLHIFKEYTLPQLLDVVGYAEKSLRKFNFAQIWTADDLEYRHFLVGASAIAARFPVRIGTAVIIPYLRNPIDAVAGLATLSELTAGKELSIGVGAGERSLLGQQVEQVKQISVVREFLKCCRLLLAGEQVNRDEIPTLSSYFHLKAPSFRLRFNPKSDFRLYYGCSQVPGFKTLGVVGALCDGIFVSNALKDFQTMEQIIQVTEESHNKTENKSGREGGLRKILMINASVSRDEKAARAHAKRFVSHSMCAQKDENLIRRGIDPAKLQGARTAYSRNEGVEVAGSLIPEEIVDKVIIAGTPKQCIERIAGLLRFAEKHDFDQVCMAVPLGPTPREVIDAWSQEILPSCM